MSNSLTRRTALGFMPLFLRILLCHYYKKLSNERSRENSSAVVVPLRREELMYDEAFSIVRVSYPFPSIRLAWMTFIHQNFMDATTESAVILYTAFHSFDDDV
jgi:hypothetical protein